MRFGSPANKGAGARRPVPAVALLLLSAFGCASAAWLFFEYQPFLKNGIFQIPLLEAYLNPDLYRNDYIVRVPAYASLLWPVVGGLARIIGLDSALLVGCAIQNTLFHFAVAVLALRISRNLPWSIIVSASFLMLPQAFIGASFFYDPTFLSHTGMSVPVLILAVAAGLSRHWIRALITWIVAAAIHIPNAAYVAPMLLCMHFATPSSPASLIARRHPKLTLAVIVAGVALCVPALWIFVARLDRRAIEWDLFRILTGRGPGQSDLHLYWSLNFSMSWRLSIFAAQTCLVTAAFILSWKRAPRLRPFAIGYAALFVPLSNAWLAESLHSVTISRLMWMRAGDFLCLFALLFSFAFAGHRSMAGKAGFAPASLLFVFMMTFSAHKWPWGYWIAVLALPMIPFRIKCGAISVWGRRIDWNVTAAAVSLALALVFHLPRRVEMRNRELVRSPMYTEYRKAQEWASVHTPRDAVFLTPLHSSGWRVFSRRSAYLEHRDRVAIILGDSIAREFVRRSWELTFPVGEFENIAAVEARYDGLSDASLQAFARREKVAFGVFDRDKQTSLPVAYRNSIYKIVEFSPSSETTTTLAVPR